jgi:transcriptional regulator with XRE-family HTH domain
MAKRPREKTAEILGANVRYLRERASISQVELARRMADRGWSWHQATVYRVETGKQPVRFDEALDLADLLGVTLDRLTWEIGQAAEEEQVTRTISSVREAMQEAAVAVTRLRYERLTAGVAARATADSDYPSVRELGAGLAEDLQSVTLDAALELADILWKRYKQSGVGWDPTDRAPFKEELQASNRLGEVLQHIAEKYAVPDDDQGVIDFDLLHPEGDGFIRKEDQDP